MKKIEPNKTYELHRPRELSRPDALEGIRRQLGDETYKIWLEARERAQTAGPMIMAGSLPSGMSGARVNELYTKALLEGANPCYVDEQSGQVFIGEYVFVPSPDND